MFDDEANICGKETNSFNASPSIVLSGAYDKNQSLLIIILDNLFIKKLLLINRLTCINDIKIKKYSNQFKFLITYDNCPEIREMYNWCSELLDKEWNHTINRTDDQRNGKKLKDGFKNQRYKGKDVFITNYNSYDIELVF